MSGRADEGASRQGLDLGAEPGLGGFRCTVFLANLFALPPDLADFLALPREAFDTPEQVLSAGWRVD